MAALSGPYGVSLRPTDLVTLCDQYECYGAWFLLFNGSRGPLAVQGFVRMVFLSW